MRTLLALALLASLLGGLVGGPVESQAADLQAVVVSQGGGHSGPMTAMGCGACSSMGACIASPAAQHAGSATSRLPLREPSHGIFGRICAPETAPPKPSSL